VLGDADSDFQPLSWGTVCEWVAFHDLEGIL
jgi:hypothetical protein